MAIFGKSGRKDLLRFVLNKKWWRHSFFNNVIFNKSLRPFLHLNALYPLAFVSSKKDVSCLSSRRFCFQVTWLIKYSVFTEYSKAVRNYMESVLYKYILSSKNMHAFFNLTYQTVLLKSYSFEKSPTTIKLRRPQNYDEMKNTTITLPRLQNYDEMKNTTTK